MRLANEARSAELAVTSLLSIKREWNNCFIKFLELQKFGSKNYERRNRENPRKIEKLEDAMLCNTLWSDRRRLITKTFLALSRPSKRRN